MNNPSPVGFVVNIQGTLLAIQSNGRQYPLKQGDALYENQQLITTKGSEAVIEMSSGKIIKLEGGQKIVLNVDDENQNDVFIDENPEIILSDTTKNEDGVVSETNLVMDSIVINLKPLAEQISHADAINEKTINLNMDSFESTQLIANSVLPSSQDNSEILALLDNVNIIVDTDGADTLLRTPAADVINLNNGPNTILGASDPATVGDEDVFIINSVNNVSTADYHEIENFNFDKSGIQSDTIMLNLGFITSSNPIDLDKWIDFTPNLATDDNPNDVIMFVREDSNVPDKAYQINITNPNYLNGFDGFDIVNSSMKYEEDQIIAKLLESNSLMIL